MKTRAATVRRVFAMLTIPALLLAILVPVLTHREALWEILSTPEAMGQFLEESGAVVSLAYTGFHILRAWVFFIPGDVPQVAGGYLFGWGLGFLYTMIGMAVGNFTTFMSSRFLGVPFVREVVGQRRFDRFYSVAAGAKAQVGFLFLFLIPGFPKNVLSFIAGVSPIKARTFMFISLLARAPGVLGSSIIGSSAADRQFTVVIAVYSVGGLVALVGLIYRKRLESWIFRLSRSPDAKIEPQTTGDSE